MISGKGMVVPYPKRIPFVPTPPDVVKLMLKLASPSDKDLVIDLGSGDGRIVKEASLSYGARAVGIEKNPKLADYSLKRIKDEKIGNVKIVKADMFSYDFSDASIITAYLTSNSLKMLKPKLEALKPGTKIVSHDFRIPGWIPVEVEEKISSYDSKLHRVYLYKLPESMVKRF